jgi:Short C-terminal domain
MSFSEELQKLAGLREKGLITQAEFEQAKKRLFNEPSSTNIASNQQDRVMQLAELERIDREWELEREKYYMVGRYGRTYKPTTGSSLFGMLLVGGFGIFWTIMAFTITQSAPFPLVGVVFPLFGIIFIGIAVYNGFNGMMKSEQYDLAERKYLNRRRLIEQQGIEFKEH